MQLIMLPVTVLKQHTAMWQQSERLPGWCAVVHDVLAGVWLLWMLKEQSNRSLRGGGPTDTVGVIPIHCVDHLEKQRKPTE